MTRKPRCLVTIRREAKKKALTAILTKEAMSHTASTAAAKETSTDKK